MTKITIRLVVISLILFFTRTGFSQNSPVRLGLKVAPCITWMNPNEKNYIYNGAAAGISFGFISEFHFGEHYAITSGFNFSFLSGNLQFPYALSHDTGSLDRKYNFRYLEVPLMVKMKTKEYGNFNFFGQIGFGTGFNLRTKVTDNFMTGNHGTITDKKNLTTSEVCFIREAILVGLGTEYKIDESVSLIVGLSYSNSLNNVLLGKNTKDNSLSNRSSLNYVALDIGVLF
jgi:Outer membrane protein beta-barrel domain